MPTADRMSIKDYIDLMREQGQTPAFTNIAGQTGQFGPEQAYVTPEYEVAGPGQGIPDPSQQRFVQPGPAMPERAPEQEPPEEVDENDPWAMANEALPAMLDELRTEMFPTKRPQDQLTQQEWQRFSNGAKSIRNALVDRFKWQIDRRDELEKERKARIKGAGITQAQILRMGESFARSYDPSNPQQEDEQAYIRRMVDGMLEMAEEFAPVGEGGEAGVIEGRGERGQEPMTVAKARQQGQKITIAGTYQGKRVIQIGDNYFLEDPKTKALSPVNITGGQMGGAF